MTDNRKTYAVQKSTLEALGIELVIASKEYEKQLGETPLSAIDEDFYKEQIEYLDRLIIHLNEITSDELLLI